MADALSRVCFKARADVHRAAADLNRAAADLNKAGADLNKAGADLNKEIHFITTKSCPIDIKSIQEATMQDQDLNKLKDVNFKHWPEYRKQCPQELWDYWTFRCDLSSYQNHSEVRYLKLYILVIKEKPNAYFLQGNQCFDQVLQMILNS